MAIMGPISQFHFAELGRIDLKQKMKKKDPHSRLFFKEKKAIGTFHAIKKPISLFY